MEISLADERALIVTERLSVDQAEGRAQSSKMDAFGTMVRMARFLQRPGDEDFDLLVPGDGIAVKLARKGIDVARKQGDRTAS